MGLVVLVIQAALGVLLYPLDQFSRHFRAYLAIQEVQACQSCLEVPLLPVDQNHPFLLSVRLVQEDLFSLTVQPFLDLQGVPSFLQNLAVLCHQAFHRFQEHLAFLLVRPHHALLFDLVVQVVQ